MTATATDLTGRGRPQDHAPVIRENLESILEAERARHAEQAAGIAEELEKAIERRGILDDRIRHLRSEHDGHIRAHEALHSVSAALAQEADQPVDDHGGNAEFTEPPGLPPKPGRRLTDDELAVGRLLR